MKIENILVPVDFSPCSKDGLCVATKLASHFGSTIHMMNAIHIPAPTIDVGATTIIEPMISDYEKETKEAFERLKEEIPELQQVACNSKIFVAHTVDAIYTGIKTRNIDLLVMGTHKDHSKAEHLLGGISSEVVGFASCPVLVVPEGVKSCNPKEIAFAVDFKEIQDLSKLDMLRNLAQAYGARIHMVHVSSEDEKDVSGNSELVKSLNEYFREFETSFHYITGKKVKDSLLNYINSEPIDMLAMMPRKHDLFERLFKGSVTKKLVLDTRIPVLSLHE